tara:strand:- start:45 stop:404 length:360 start_codon:yes stop_codon:yes gene_type:complete
MALTTNLTWNITDTIRDKSDGFVTEIKYSITGVATESSTGEKYTHIATGGYQVPDHTRKGDEISFETLTESQIIDWVKAGMGDEVAFWEETIPKHLENQANGVFERNNVDTNSTSGLPW